MKGSFSRSVAGRRIISARRAMLGSAAVAVLAAAPAVRAQETAGEGGTAASRTNNPDEIIVTATKREQTLQDVPVAVTVTTGETIERAAIRDLKDLQSVVPSLRVNQLQSSANTNFYIRGFGNGANNAGIEPSVGLFIDGVYRSRSASMIADFPDVERIEVLRGPQSTLFGKNASAGVISIVTKKPQFQLGGNLEASYGNYNAVVVKGMVTGPLSDTVAVSLAGGLNKRNGIVRDLATGNKTNDRDRWFVRGQALFEPSKDLSIRLIGDYGKIDENCCAVVNLRQALPTAAIFALGGAVTQPSQEYDNITYNNFESTNKIKNWGFSGQIDYDLGGAKLTSITAYRRTNAVTNQDSDFSSADLLGRNYQDLRIKTFTQELRLNFDVGERIHGLLGGYYFNEKIAQDNQVYWGKDARGYADLLVQGLTGGKYNIGHLNPQDLELILGSLEGNPAKYVGKFFAPGTGLTENCGLKNDAWSVFSQVDFEIADGLTLTGGINYTHDKKSFRTNTTSNDTFAGVDLMKDGQTAIYQQALATQVGTLLGLGRPATAAEIGGFAAANATAFAQVNAGVQAYAASNAANPAVNGLLGLRGLQYFPPFMNLPNAVEPGRVSDGHFSYTARLAYDVTPTVNVYLSYATGYKAASVNLSRDSRPTPADLATLQAQGLAVTNLTAGSRYANPETSTVYEAGLKANWGLATANVAVFKQEIKDFQSNLFTGSGFFLANAGKQSVFGIEFEGTARPVDQLLLSLAMTYLDGKYNSFKASGVGDITGSTPPGYSPLSVTFAGTWTQEMGNGDKLIARADYHYEAPFMLVEGLPGLTVKNPATGQIVSATAAIQAARDFKQEINDVNASLTYAMANGLDISIWGRNLLNDRTILQIFDSPAQPGSISGYPNQPRTYGVSARFSF